MSVVSLHAVSEEAAAGSADHHARFLSATHVASRHLTIAFREMVHCAGPEDMRNAVMQRLLSANESVIDALGKYAEALSADAEGMRPDGA